MNYTIDEQDIHFVTDEPQPIPLDAAIKEIERIADKQREALAHAIQSSDTTTTLWKNNEDCSA